MTIKEEYTKVSIGVPRLSDFQIKDGINNGLNLIEEINKLVIKDEQERYIRELLNRIDKAIQFIKEHNKNAGKLYYKYNNKYLLSEIKEDLLEILGGKE